MNDQHQPTISKISVKINQTGCSVIVAFLADEHIWEKNTDWYHG